MPLYQAFVRALAPLGRAYLHVVQAGDDALLRWIRPEWPTALIVNRAGRPREKIAADVDEGLADIASVAQFALANPDLVARRKANAPLKSRTAPRSSGGTRRDIRTTRRCPCSFRFALECARRI